MKHRIITSVIALSLLAAMPAWGQTNVIRRGQTEAEKAHADRQRRQAAERARREEAERIRIEKLEAEAEIEKQEIAKGELLVVDDNPVKEIGENAFWGCTNLTKFELSEELLPTISKNTFHQCRRLDYLTVYAEDGKTRSVNNYYRHWK